MDQETGKIKPLAKAYIGIDPGKHGALAILSLNELGQKWKIEIFPFDERVYRRELKRVAPATEVRCCVERVSAMPGQGVVSMFHFGENYGWIRGLLDGEVIPYFTVPPQTWKKHFSLGKDKKASIDCVHRLFPEVSLLRTDKCHKDDDGMAEALLMAEYARREW